MAQFAGLAPAGKVFAFEKYQEQWFRGYLFLDVCSEQRHRIVSPVFLDRVRIAIACATANVDGVRWHSPSALALALDALWLALLGHLIAPVGAGLIVEPSQ